MKLVPSANDVLREALLMIAAGLVVAWVLRQSPQLKEALNPDK